MHRYRITNQLSGVELGVYEGETPDEALNALARDAGYATYVELCDLSPLADDREILVSLID